MVSVQAYQKIENIQEVSVVYPEVKTIYDTVTLYGTIKEDCRKNLYAQGNAEVEKVFVKSGDMVKKGDPLMQLKPMDQDEAQQNNTLYEDAERWAAQIAENGVSDTDSLRSDMQTAFRKVSAQQNTESDSMEAYQLYSPMDGMVVYVSARRGETISALFPCVAVTDLNALSVHAEAAQNILSQIAEKDHCSIAVEAFGTGNYTGTITAIKPYARQTGFMSGSGEATTEVIISLYNRQQALRPGYSATIKVSVNQQNNAVLVPYEAIAQDENGKEYVLVLSGNSVYRQYVTTGSELDDTVQVISGVFPEDVLIGNPNKVDCSKQVTVHANE